jgi:serine/threonine-protein kinase ULK4
LRSVLFLNCLVCLLQVRRCAMATLGELLFYIATQNEVSPRSGAGHEIPVKDGRSLTWQVSVH